ncbi:hypothetical protein O9929_02630 [Vibrio lentus]|nr:hypothetical protein [Vibrio lentus]
MLKAITQQHYVSQLDFIKNPAGSIPLAEVEPIEKILKRFCHGCYELLVQSWQWRPPTLGCCNNRIGAKIKLR